MDMQKTGFVATAVLVVALSLSACSAQRDTQALPRTAATTSQMAINVETIADKLRAPWSVAVLPDGGFLVTEQPGYLLRIGKDGKRAEISGLPEDIYVQGHGGLLEVVLAPDFADSQIIYLSYAKGTKKANQTALLRARLVGGALVDSQIIFAAAPAKDTASHFGGRIVFLSDGTLILALG